MRTRTTSDSLAVLAYGPFVAAPTTPPGSGVGSAVDASDVTRGDDVGERRRRRSV